MKLSRRLLSLLLVCFVCFGLFSVNAFAVEDENLIDSDIRNWVNISTIDSTFSDKFIGHYSNGEYQFKLLGSPTPGRYGGIYTLTNLVVGENYVLNFDFRISQKSLENITWMVGVGFLNGNELTYFSDETHIVIAIDNYSEFDYVLGEYNSIHLPFKYTASLGEPCVIITGICHTDSNITNPTLYLRDISLMRQSSETEKKLDGILGWLQDIKNSIVGLPEIIKTNFQNFFIDLENKINDFKNTVTEKFTTLSTEFSSYITNLGNNIKGFFDDFWDNISQWFEKFKPRINVDFNFKSGALNTNTGKFEYPAGNSYVLSDVIYIPDGVEMHLNYTTINSVGLKYIPVTSNGDYTGRYDQYFTDFELLLDTSRYFRIETRSYATSFIECYVDVGWFTYYMYTLRHKIDIKIEEIKQSLHDLFIPSDGYFNELSNRFDLLIEERFGALVTITDYLVEFFSSFNADTTKEFFDVPIININLMGYNFPIGGWQVRFVPQFNGVEILTNACKFISSVLATFAFFDGLKNKYHEVFGGGE